MSAAYTAESVGYARPIAAVRDAAVTLAALETPKRKRRSAPRHARNSAVSVRHVEPRAVVRETRVPEAFGAWERRVMLAADAAREAAEAADAARAEREAADAADMFDDVRLYSSAFDVLVSWETDAARAEREPCDRLTPGCAIKRHIGTDTECESY